jgi:putative transposase
MSTSYYASDLTDAEWALLEPLLPVAKNFGRPRQWSLRQVLDGIFYLLRSGCSWRLLPREYPAWRTVYGYFRAWRDDGTWEEVHRALREQVRLQAGREATPSAAILDSQSVKTTEKGGFAALMAARKSMVVSAIFWWTPWAWCSK